MKTGKDAEVQNPKEKWCVEEESKEGEKSIFNITFTNHLSVLSCRNHDKAEFFIKHAGDDQSSIFNPFLMIIF